MNWRNFPWLSMVIVLGIAAVLGYIYHFKMEWYETEEFHSRSDEVRENDLLASTRIMRAFGYETEQIQDALSLRNLDDIAGQTIWLFEADALSDDDRMADLDAWAKDGGHLILGLTPNTSDRLDKLLLNAGIEAYTNYDDIGHQAPWELLYEKKRLDEAYDEDSTGEEHSYRTHHSDFNHEYEFKHLSSHTYYSRGADSKITIPTDTKYAEAITVSFDNTAELYSDLPLIRALKWPHRGAEGPNVVAQTAYGDGFVTVLGDANMFINTELKQNHDNGYFLLSLLSVNPNSKVHYLLDLRETPTLLRTLWHYYPTMVSLFIVALLAWVWNAATRLGPVRVEEKPSRTNLMAHLRARGHFWRRRGDLTPLSEPVRTAALRELKRRSPNLMSSSIDTLPTSLISDIGAAIHCTPAQVKLALSSKPLAARDLPTTGRILQHILHQPKTRSKNATRSNP